MEKEIDQLKGPFRTILCTEKPSIDITQAFGLCIISFVALDNMQCTGFENVYSGNSSSFYLLCSVFFFLVFDAVFACGTGCTTHKQTSRKE